LKDIDIYEFSFEGGFLVHKTRKINLEAFLGVAESIWKEKEKMLTINNQHNLTNVYREKSEMGVFSDYPHFYKIIREGKTDPFLFGTRPTENGNFVISQTEGQFCMYGPNHLGTLESNFTGTQFELYDWGIESSKMTELPKGFFSVRRHVTTIEYDSNYFAEKPRAFRIHNLDWTATK